MRDNGLALNGLREWMWADVDSAWEHKNTRRHAYAKCLTAKRAAEFKLPEVDARNLFTTQMVICAKVIICVLDRSHTFNEIRSFLADHDGWSIGIAGRDGWHD